MKPPSEAKLRALEDLIRESAALSHRVSAVTEMAHGGAALTSSERELLTSLDQRSPRTVPQLARARPTSRQRIQMVVNGLIREGLVETMENPAHKRSRLIRLTAGGRQALLELRRRERRLLSGLPASLTKKELRSAAATIRAVREAFESPQWRLRAAVQG